MKAKLVIVLSLLCLGSIYLGPAVRAADPTRPDQPVKEKKGAAAVTKFRLSMIQMAKSGPRAVINGKAVSIGDHIGSYRVTHIKPSYVILNNNKGQIRLNLITRGALRKS